MAITSDSPISIPAILSRAKPIARMIATSRRRSRTDIAAVLAATSVIVVSTMTQRTFAIVNSMLSDDIKLVMKPTSLSVIVSYDEFANVSSTSAMIEGIELTLSALIQ